MKHFLNDKQKKSLKESEWDVFDNPKYLHLYADEFKKGTFEEISEFLNVNSENNKITLLIIGTK